MSDRASGKYTHNAERKAHGASHTESPTAEGLASVCIYSLLKIKNFMYNDLKEFHNKVTYLDLVEIQGGSVDEI